ncbi:acyltransferase [Rhodococcus sp. GXMU-t2271]|uniref:acyltransferase family protein n=1 Tax=Rhodococcus sp. GXMU-t2271 TaxID=3059079 RepID=UPI00352B9123
MAERILQDPYASDISRDNLFDFIRLFAASAVVVQHGVNLLDERFLWHGSSDNYWFFDGVSMFFVMSGLFVYRSAERTFSSTGNWLDYCRNRFLRVAPAIYVYVVVVVVVMMCIGAINWRDMINLDVFAWLVGCLFLLPGHDPSAFASFGTGILNGSLWTIPVEVSFYALAPVLVALAHRYGFHRMLVALTPIAIVGPIVVHLVGGVFENLLHHTFIEYLSCFAAGILLSGIWHRIPRHWSFFVAAVAAYIAVIAFTPPEISAVLDPLVILAPLAFATIWFGFYGPQVFRLITDRIGDISFGTYIWHWPLINLFIWFDWTSGQLTVLALLFASWCMGFLSWRVIERPAMRLKRVSARSPVGGSCQALR